MQNPKYHAIIRRQRSLRNRCPDCKAMGDLLGELNRLDCGCAWELCVGAYDTIRAARLCAVSKARQRGTVGGGIATGWWAVEDDERTDGRVWIYAEGVSVMKRATDLIDWNGIRNHLSDVVSYYQRSAPTVANWADNLYIRLDEERDKVVVSELLHALTLKDEGGWLPPNLAANGVYHLMHRLGQDTTGHAGF